jgi:hypothetical protein
MLNFAGTSNFRIGNVLNLTIANSTDIQNAITSGKMLKTPRLPRPARSTSSPTSDSASLIG